MDEIQILREISGTAMSIACVFGYSPQLFYFALHEFITNSFPGLTGYKIVFCIVAGFALCGVLVTIYLFKMIKAKKERI